MKFLIAIIIPVSIFIVWFTFFTIYSIYWFTKKFEYLENSEIFKNPLYKGYVRNDKEEWSFWEFYFTGLFLLPLRFILFFLIIIMLYVLLRPFSCLLRES